MVSSPKARAKLFFICFLLVSPSSSFRTDTRKEQRERFFKIKAELAAAKSAEAEKVERAEPAAVAHADTTAIALTDIVKEGDDAAGGKATIAGEEATTKEAANVAAGTEAMAEVTVAAEATADAEATALADVKAEARAGDPCDVTGFDEMFATHEKKMRNKDSLPRAGPNTVLLVIDAQNGFTTNSRDTKDVGGFAQPCLVKKNEHHLATLHNIRAEIEEVKLAGGLIIATKDYHPVDHCSFIGQNECKNNRESADNYARKANGQKGAYEYDNNRYINSFPPHCVGTINGETKNGSIPANWTSTGNTAQNVFKPHLNRGELPVESGTDLHQIISEAMQGYGRSFIAYKGFSRDFESFGAFPMDAETADQKKVGSKLWVDSNGEPQRYREFLNPPARAFEDYMSTGHGFMPLENYLKTQKIKNVRVAGYVWDFCVKETAIGAVQAKFLDTSVLAYATRPALDGIPANVCVPDSGLPGEPRGWWLPCLGSAAVSENTYRQLIANKVKVVTASLSKFGRLKAWAKSTNAGQHVMKMGEKLGKSLRRSKEKAT